jgi:hypothetical protein
MGMTPAGAMQRAASREAFRCMEWMGTERNGWDRTGKDWKGEDRQGMGEALRSLAF